MSVTFKLVPHGMLRDVTIVEIWVGGKMVGAIYPQEPNAVRLFSAHLEGEQGMLAEFRFEL